MKSGKGDKKMEIKRNWWVYVRLYFRRAWRTIKSVPTKWTAWMRSMRRKRVQKNALGYNRTLLSPMILSPQTSNRIDQYRYDLVNELRNAIASNNCNNIAITGVYGSGKSSIIQTYLAEMSSSFRAKKVLTLSLSNFMDQGKKVQDEAYERTIENKIFQHILFKANEDKTAQSHYKKIDNISGRRALGIAIYFILAILCYYIVFNPNYLLSFKYISNLFNSIHSFEYYRLIHTVVYIGAILYMICLLIQCIIYIIRRIRKVNIKGVEVKNMKVDFGESTKTPFNELLDEILYFFRAGGYEIVIFEDLDRIANTERLFLKLREINLLLNESDYYKRARKRIKFIYAIRDDLFESDIRTKCFDYIIPVIPVVDKYNAGDYLIKHYGDNIMKSIGERHLGVLGMYIREKRELSNIVNEYAISYKAFINNTTSTMKLLAMLVYKNAYPKDYAKAYRKEGCLYAIFNPENKKEFYAQLIDGLDRRDTDILREINRLSDEIEQYRGTILDVLKKAHVTRLRYKGEDYPVDDFKSNDLLYNAFVNNKIEYYKDAKNEVQPYKFEYAKLAAEASTEVDAIAVLNGNSARIAKLQQERNETQREIEKLKTARIRALIRKQDSRKVLEIIYKLCTASYQKETLTDEQQKRLKQQADLLLVFLREGYIAEDYATYMSLTYEGALTESDFKFVNAVMQDIVLEPNHPINNINAVIQRLNSDDYQKRSILNNNLVDYVLQAKENVNLRDVIEVARKDFAFILQYAQHSKNRARFLQRLFDSWRGVVAEIEAITDDFKTRDGMLRLLLEVSPRTIALEEDEKEYLEGRYDFVCQNILSFNITKLEQFAQYHKLKFTKLLPPDESTKALFDFVTENSLFAITVENLRIIYGGEFDNAACTQIYKGKKEIYEYVQPEFEALLDKMPETSVHEEPDVIVKLINDKDIDSATLLNYIIKQEVQIDLKDVEDPYVSTLIEKTKIVRPTWENVDSAYVRISAEEDKDLAQFVKLNIDALASNLCDTENADEIEKMLLLVTDVFTNEEYERISECFTKKMGQPELEGMEVPDDHMRILIKKERLTFDKDTFDCIEANYSTQILAAYIIANFAAFIQDDEITVTESNELGIEILNSELSLDEKRQYMEVLPFDKDEKKAEEYAKLYCFYYEKIGEYQEADMEALIDAMKMYQEDGSWYVKMSIINQINRTKDYDKDVEKKLIDALGGGYVRLNQLDGKETYYDNPQNRELLGFLKEKEYPYISKVYPPEGGLIKVTFKKKLKE